MRSRNRRVSRETARRDLASGFTKWRAPLRIRCYSHSRCATGWPNRRSYTRTDSQGAFMAVVSGELIRMMNYVDDIAATLRRITVHYSSLTPEEKTRLADYMEK